MSPGHRARAVMALWLILGCVEQDPQWIGEAGDGAGGGDAGDSGQSSIPPGSTNNDGRTGGSDDSTDGSGGGSDGSADTGTTDDGGATTGGVCDVQTCPWWDPAWSWRSYVDIDLSEVSETLASVPILVVLDPERIAYEQLTTNAVDLRIVGDDGSELPYEIEQWEPAGTSFVWVGNDELAGNDTTRIWLYYGNPAAGPSADVTPWDGYGAVWHLGDLQDSSDGAHHGTAQGVVGGPGSIGGAQQFDGLGSHIQIENQTDLQYTQALTMSAWFKAEGVDDASSSNVIVSMGGSGEMQSGNFLYGINFDPEGAVWTFWESSGAYDQNIKSSATAPWADGSWHHVAVVRDSSNTEVRFYFDGALLGNVRSYGWPPTGGSGASLLVGADAEKPNDYNFNGWIDELRLVPATRSAAWIFVQYRAGRDQLNDYGAPQSRP